MKTFVLGAGGSLHAEYPLASQLWNSLAKWIRASFPPEHDFSIYVTQFEEWFDVRKPFEIALSDLVDRIKNPTDRFERVILAQLRAGIERIITAFFDTLRFNKALLYERLAKNVLVPGDAVITFNYDLALDHELSKAGLFSVLDGYGFDTSTADSPSSRSKCLILKLHGSTNWIGSLFNGSIGVTAVSRANRSLGQRPVIPPTEFEYFGSEARDPKFHGGGMVYSLILPTARKQFYMETSFGNEWEEFWDSLWRQADAVLRRSESIYVVGYSFPEYDERARTLLSTAPKKQASIYICCHADSDKVTNLFRNWQFENVQVVAGGCFENLV